MTDKQRRGAEKSGRRAAFIVGDDDSRPYLVSLTFPPVNVY